MTRERKLTVIIEIEKAKRKRERALAELEAVKLSEKEKREAKKAINDYYDTLEKDAQLKDDEARKQKELEASELAAEKLALEKENDLLSFEEQRALINEREELLKNDETINDKDRLKLKEQFSKAKIKIADLEAKAEKKRVADTSNALNQLSDVVGKNTVAGKGMAVAAATINTYQGITAELATKTTTPFGFALKLANIATTAAIGFKSVKDILKTNPENASSSVSNPSTGASAPVQEPQFNIVGQGAGSQIASALGEQQQAPIQAFVVSQDVTTAQSLENNIIQGATLGG